MAAGKMVEGKMLLSVNQVSKDYGGSSAFLHRTFPAFFRAPQRVLDNISFEINQGENVGLVGASGAGKSTLARLICGIERATSGEILLNGSAVTGAKTRRNQLSLLSQNYADSVNPTMNVLQAIREPLIIQGEKDRTIIQEKAAALLEKVGLNADLFSKPVRQLSGGQIQRVTLCRALIHRPKLIILDEPTSALDVVHQVQFLDLLKTFQEEHSLSYFFISHNLAAVAYLCERVLFLEKGKLRDHHN